ncbi:MAG: inorganic pyrophosphatase, partial [Erysipelothrix sp.]|nr:inorganic pyrophosphatase [Erysipelothrix sp.]
MNSNFNEVIYITGHRNPDTDSIVSAIAYAELKQKMNVNAIACRLGDVNAETKYLLDRFNVKEPMLLVDARSQLDEIEMDEPVKISPETTIMEAVTLMNSFKQKPVLAVVNRLDQLLGILTSSNISDVLLGDTAKSIDLLSRTPIEYIAKTIDGKLIYAPEKTRLNGKTSIIAISASKLDNYEITDRIVIVGNDTDAQLDCIAKNA